ncbi:MAG: hypothetical protein MI861_15105, partial [Pirellulales bacterium]|nr:hypothetical protein [Pirellulales bacterium]
MADNFNGDVYVRTNDATGRLEWGTDGSTFEAISETLTDKSAAQILLSYSASDDFLNNFAIDTLSSLVIGDFQLPGVDVGFHALQIQVQPGATVSTAQPVGQSGNLTLNAPLVGAAPGSQLITDHAADTDIPGDFLISAQGNLDTVISFLNSLPILPKASNTEAIVQLTGATIRAGDVTIDADADSADKYDDQDPENRGNFGMRALEGLSDFVGSFSLFVGFAFSEADSIVTIDGGSIVSDSLTVTSDASTQAQTTVFSNVAFVGGLAISEPNADITVKGGAEIQTTGDVQLASNANSNSSVIAFLRSKKHGGAVAFNFSNIDSNAEVSANSSITAGGAVDVTADATKRQFNSGRASAFAGSRTTLSAVYSQGITEVTAAIDGTVAAAGDITVESQFETPINDNNAASTTGISGVTAKGVARIKNSKWKINAPLRGLVNAITGKSQGGLTKSPTGFAGSFSVGHHTNDVEARIGAGGNVVSTNGNIRVAADSTEFPQLLSSSTVASQAADSGSGIQGDTRDNSLSIAFSVGVFQSEARAFIGDNAIVSAAGDLTVQSATHVPWEQQWWKFFNREEGDKLSGGELTGLIGEFAFKKFSGFYNAGIQEGFFTTWAEAFTEAKKRAIGAQGNILVLNNTSEARIGRGAQVTVGGDTSVVSTNENDSLNFSGQAFFKTGGADTGTSPVAKGIGGSFLTVSYNSTSIAEVQSAAVVDSGSLLVMSRSDSRNISISTQGGRSSGRSVNGTASALVVNDRTLARIDDGAIVTTRNSLVEVPRDFDEVDTSQSGLFSGVPTFIPREPLEDAVDADLRVNVDSDTITLPYLHLLTTGDAV